MFSCFSVAGSVSQFLRLMYKSPSALVALQIMDATGRLILKLIILTLFVSYSFAGKQGRGRLPLSVRDFIAGAFCLNPFPLRTAVLYMDVYHDVDSFGADYCASLDPVTHCRITDGELIFDEFACSWLIVFQVSRLL